MNASKFTYQGLNYRTVTVIQKKVIKQGKRNAVSRTFHAKGDKDKILAWRQDLNGILHVFNVRAVSPARHPLTATFQTELTINTHMLVVDIHRNRNTLNTGEDGVGVDQSVSTTSRLSTTRS